MVGGGDLPAVGALDSECMARTRERLDRLTKPPGSLGRLEALAVQLAGITAKSPPAVRPATVVVMAADHGVVAEGVSAYPSAVTAQMVRNFLAGGAAINVLARHAGLRVVVVDVGVASGPGACDERNAGVVCFRNRKIQAGTANLARRPAMIRQAALQAISVGLDVAAEEEAGGSRVLCLGEMGIGNTTAASALAAVFTGQPLDLVVGPGTGLDAGGLSRKRAAIRRALELHRPDPGDPLAVLAAVGGLEIAGLVGLILGAAAARLPVILDGFIAGAAALVACRLEPGVKDYLIAAHRSAEPGHKVVLDFLGLEPLLALDLRLGEGTGACLAFGLVEAAAAVVQEMATFDEAGVAGRLTDSCPPEARLPAGPVQGTDPTVNSSETILVLGGVRSGKSRHARTLAAARAAATGFPVLFLATGLATDAEMRRRIARHRGDRPPEWRTVEARETLAGVLAGVDRPHVILLDDVGFVASACLWQLSGQAGEEEIAADAVNETLATEMGGLLRAARAGGHVLIVVSNEVGMGVVPVSPAGRHFRDLVGAANQHLAQEADQVILMVAGIPVPLREGRPPGGGDGHG